MSTDKQAEMPDHVRLVALLRQRTANLASVSGYAKEDYLEWRAAEAITALLAERERLRRALEEIKKPQYGLDLNDDDKTRADYWSKWAQCYRDIARAALQPKD